MSEKIKEYVDKLIRLKTVWEGVFWKGKKEHPEKMEFLQAFTHTIKILERLDEDKIAKIIALGCGTPREKAQAILTELLKKE